MGDKLVVARVRRLTRRELDRDYTKLYRNVPARTALDMGWPEHKVVNRVAKALGVLPNVTLLNAFLDDWVQQVHVRRES